MRPTLLAAVSAISASMLVGILSIGTIGCTRTVEPEKPKERYLTRGPKENFPPYLTNTIFERVDLLGTEPAIISGYGLVVNLENTGRDDGIPTSIRDYLLQDAVRLGVGEPRTDATLGSLSPGSLLADPRTTVVKVDGYVPPGARKGQRIDVQVTALDSNSTPSLARGFLWQTQLDRGGVSERRLNEQVRQAGVARGSLLVNPIFALSAPEAVKNDPAAQASLRQALIPGGGVTFDDRMFYLRLRNPEKRIARRIEERINYHFGQKVAAAQDEGVVLLTIPSAGPWSAKDDHDWEHFIGVTVNLDFYGGNPAYATNKAAELAVIAQDASRTEAELVQISYVWEGLGQVVLPKLMELINDPNPAVAYYAARAAVHLRDPSAINAMADMAEQKWNPYSVKAARELGRLEPNMMIVQRVRRLLNESVAANTQVRIEAYESLVMLGDRAILENEQQIGEKFALHTVEADGTPLVYASLTGRPTIAVIGGMADFKAMPRIRDESLVTAFGDRLTIRRAKDSPMVSIYQRRVGAVAENSDASERDFVDMVSLPDLREIIGRLGGEGAPGERRIALNYGDVVALLKSMGDNGDIVAGADGSIAVAVRIEDVAIERTDSAPRVPGLERLRTGETRAAR